MGSHGEGFMLLETKEVRPVSSSGPISSFNFSKPRVSKAVNTGSCFSSCGQVLLVLVL